MTRREVRPSPLVRALIRDQVGLDVRHLSEAEVHARIAANMAQAGFASDASYAIYLRGRPAALMALASTLTVGETYFFRDPEQLRELTREVLPEVLVVKRAAEPLWIWSAGCATGEEPYTLAMLLDQCGLLERAYVVGTDVSEASVARARAARYGAWSLRAIPSLAFHRYFKNVGREYQVADEIRRRVRFQCQSLSEEGAALPGGADRGFDVIFCKNVLMYLTDEAARRVSIRLARSLLEHGVLLTSPSDGFALLPDMWSRHTTSAGVMYKRRHAHAKTAAQQKHTPAKGNEVIGRARLKAPTQCEGSELDLSEASVRDIPELAQAKSKATLLEDCRRHVEHEPLNEALYVRMASLLIELNREPEAEVALRTALYLNQELVMAHFMMAVVQQRKGEPDRARRSYARAAALCELRPDEELVPMAEGVSYAQLRQTALQSAHQPSSARRS